MDRIEYGRKARVALGPLGKHNSVSDDARLVECVNDAMFRIPPSAVHRKSEEAGSLYEFRSVIERLQLLAVDQDKGNLGV